MKPRAQPPPTVSVVDRRGNRRFAVVRELRRTHRGSIVEHVGIDLRNWKDDGADFDRVVAELRVCVVGEDVTGITAKLLGKGVYR